MRSTRWIATALGLVALSVGAFAQNDPYEGLKAYDWQDRKPLVAITKLIQEAGTDKTKTAEIEQGLIKVVSDAGATEAGKEEACRFLWMVGSAKSVPALAKLLTDDKLADIARYGLERNIDPSAGAALRAALGKAKGKTLVGIINSVGNRHDALALGALKKLAASPDALTAEAATAAIGKIGSTAAISAAKGKVAKGLPQYDAQLTNASALVKAGKPADAQKVYLALAGADKPATVRIAALNGLAVTNSPKTVAIAFTDLKAEEPLVQRGAARVIGNLGDPKATAQAIAGFAQLSETAQIALLSAWADNHTVAAAPVATTNVTSDAPELRYAAINALAKCGGAKSVATLAEIASTSKDDADRNTAREGLILMRGKEATQEIIQLALNGKSEVRSALMGVLIERPSTESRAALKGAALGADAKTAVAALKALGQIGGAAEYADLVKLVTTTNSDEVREAAQAAVGAVARRQGNPDKAVEPILAAIPNASTAAKVALINTAAEIGGDRALAEVTNATKSSDADVKQAAISALAETWADSRPLPTLLEIAKTDASKSIRVLALRGYLQKVSQDDRLSADDKVAKFSDGVKAAERNEEKVQALSALRDCRVNASVELAAQFLDNDDLFSDAADTIINLAGQQKKGDKSLAAVKGESTNAALDKIIGKSKDDNQKTKAQQLKG